MPSHTKATPTVDHFQVATCFADRLVRIEQYGPVSHLIWAMTQRMEGEAEPVASIQARLIVPTALLPRLARQLAAPELCQGQEAGSGIPVVVLQ